MATPFFSIVIPVHNGSKTLTRCLQSVVDSERQDWELIVVDDGSTDDSAGIARRFGAELLTTGGQLGPAAARNKGALVAGGRYLFFTDADCQLHKDTLSRAARILEDNPELDALFGSYDRAPAATNFVSQYKNLFHYYIHQTSQEKAVTFWAGCGAIRRECFLALGGFDARRYPRPAVEDIELGYRLTARGGHIRLARTVQVKHLKQWTLASLIRSDVCDRAIPWTCLLRERGAIPTDLNLRSDHRLSVIILLFMLGAALWLPPLALVFAFALLWLNRRQYRFFMHERGLAFTLPAVLLHWFYYGYSAAAYLLASMLLCRIRRSGYTP